MRFQLDTQWQRDFRRWIAVTQECAQHRNNCEQLRVYDAHDEAELELEMAKEDLELAQCLEYELKHRVTRRPSNPTLV